MTCMLHRLPPDFVARTREEALKILKDKDSDPRLRLTVWKWLKDEKQSRQVSA